MVADNGTLKPAPNFTGTFEVAVYSERKNAEARIEQLKEIWAERKATYDKLGGCDYENHTWKWINGFPHLVIESREVSEWKIEE